MLDCCVVCIRLSLWLPLAAALRGSVGQFPPDRERTNPSFYPYELEYLRNSSIIYADVRHMPGLNRNTAAPHSSDDPAEIEPYYNSNRSHHATKPAPRHRHSFSVLKNLMHIGRADRVLELGCGNGISSRFIQRELKSREVVGVDLSHYFIQTAREKVPGVEFMQHDITTLRLPGRTFTVLTQIDSFEHIPRGRWEALFTVWNLHSTVGTRVYLSMPAPEYQLAHYELGIGEMQPVDEVVWPSQLTSAAERRGWSLRYLNYWNRARVDLIMVRQRMGAE
jgi:SAM-dependent methyltransferase